MKKKLEYDTPLVKTQAAAMQAATYSGGKKTSDKKFKEIVAVLKFTQDEIETAKKFLSSSSDNPD